MGLFSKTLSEMGEYALDKTKQVSQRSRINTSIEAEQAKINQAYSTLGYLYYTHHKDDAEPDMQPHIEAITAAMAAIDQFNREMQEVKQGGVKCPSCQAIVTQDAAFCPSCGENLRPAAPDQSEKPDPATQLKEILNGGSNVSSKKCPYCGADATGPICGTCGSPVD